jgi:hypothetical protein
MPRSLVFLARFHAVISSAQNVELEKLGWLLSGKGGVREEETGTHIKLLVGAV